MTYLALSCRVLLGTVFAISGVTKVSGRASFAAYVRSVRRLGSLPPALARPAALVLITAELGVVTLLAIPAAATGAGGFALAAGMLAVFSAAIIGSIRRGERAPCRCFGRSAATLTGRHVARNLILAGLALAGLAATATAGPATFSKAGSFLSAVVIGLVLGWLATEIDNIVALARPPALSPPRRSNPDM